VQQEIGILTKEVAGFVVNSTMDDSNYVIGTGDNLDVGWAGYTMLVTPLSRVTEG